MKLFLKISIITTILPFSLSTFAMKEQEIINGGGNRNLETFNLRQMHSALSELESETQIDKMSIYTDMESLKNTLSLNEVKKVKELLSNIDKRKSKAIFNPNDANKTLSCPPSLKQKYRHNKSNRENRFNRNVLAKRKLTYEKAEKGE